MECTPESGRCHFVCTQVLCGVYWVVPELGSRDKAGGCWDPVSWRVAAGAAACETCGREHSPAPDTDCQIFYIQRTNRPKQPIKEKQKNNKKLLN
jgi:hypothetical protein